jgi:hypothetical protein
VGLPGAPVQFLNIQASNATATAANPLQRGDAILDTTGTGNIDIFFGTGNLTLTGGTASAVTSGNSQLLKATAVAAIQGTDISINGTGGSMIMQGGSATADNTHGGGALAAADANVIATGSKSVSVGGDLILVGGTTNGGQLPLASNTATVSASATFDPVSVLTVNTGGNVILQAGKGFGADASIINGDDIQMTIGGSGNVSCAACSANLAGTPGGLIMIGGAGSGLFGFGGVAKQLGDEIKADFVGGGAFTQVLDPSLAPATIIANSPRNFDSLLSYIIFAANQETQAARIRAGQSTTDDSNLPSCN